MSYSRVNLSRGSRNIVSPKRARRHQFRARFDGITTNGRAVGWIFGNTPDVRQSRTSHRSAVCRVRDPVNEIPSQSRHLWRGGLGPVETRMVLWYMQSVIGAFPVVLLGEHYWGLSGFHARQTRRNRGSGTQNRRSVCGEFTTTGKKFFLGFAALLFIVIIAFCLRVTYFK